MTQPVGVAGAEYDNHAIAGFGNLGQSRKDLGVAQIPGRVEVSARLGRGIAEREQGIVEPVHRADPRRLVVPGEQRRGRSGLLEGGEFTNRVVDLFTDGREPGLSRGAVVGERLDLVVWKVTVGIDAVDVREAGAARDAEPDLDALAAVRAQI